MKEHRQNLMVAFTVALLWIIVFLVLPLLRDSTLFSNLTHSIIYAFLFGALGSLMIAGDWFDTIKWLSMAPLLPVLIVVFVLMRGVDSEAFPWVWTYGAGMLLPYWMGIALATGIIYIFNWRSAK